MPVSSRTDGRTPIVQAYAIRERDGTIIATPGHTPGQVAVWLEADRVLIAGDALASHDGRPMVGMFNSEPAVAAASARRLADLDVEIACFGHGQPLRGALSFEP